MKCLIFLGLFISSLSFAQSAFTLRLSPEGTALLKTIGDELGPQEVSFPCTESVCQIALDRELGPEVDADLIERPFVGGLLALRVYGGSQSLQHSLYDILGKHTETKTFKDKKNERVLKIDGGLIKFRCTSTREENPTHECWIVIFGNAVVM